MNAIYSNPPCRRSASMESIPSQAPPSAAPTSSSRTQHMINIYNKYGTVGGYSTSNTSSRTNNRPPLLINNQQLGADDANNQVNSRLRAVNRSFRTAVDKSFDVPNQAAAPLGEPLLCPPSVFISSTPTNFTETHSSPPVHLNRLLTKIYNSFSIKTSSRPRLDDSVNYRVIKNYRSFRFGHLYHHGTS